MRILVIRLTSMGDVVLATSLFSYLRKQRRHDEIHFVTDVRYKDLFVDDPRLASVTTVGGALEREEFAALSAMTWDRVVDLQNNRRSRRICRRYFGSVPARTFDKLHRERFLLLLLRHSLYNRRDTVAARYIRASGLSPADPQSVPGVRLYFDGDGAGVKRRLLGEEAGGRPTVALMPFAAWKNKQWPLESYTAVGRYFAGRRWNVVILGGAGDKVGAAHLRDSIGGCCASCAGEVTLHEIGSLLTTSDLALGNDTGLTHMARACGVKTGVVYGATTWHFGFFPFGEPAFKVFETGEFCRPCHPHGGNLCWRSSRPCLHRVTPGQVIEGLVELHGRA
jgi:heptosyltransferase-2